MQIPSDPDHGQSDKESLHSKIHEYFRTLHARTDRVISVPNDDLKNLVHSVTGKEIGAVDLHYFAVEFFRELAVFLEDTEALTGTDDAAIERFHDNLQELLFRQGVDHLTDALQPSEKFALSSRITSIRQAQRWIGVDMVKDLAADILRLPHEEMTHIADDLLRLPSASLLNCIHLCETLVICASISSDSETLNQNGIDVAKKLRLLLSYLRQVDHRPLVQIEIALIDENLKNMEKGQVIPASFGFGRASVQGRASMNGTRDGFSPIGALPIIRGKIKAVAADAIGLFDQSNRLVEVAMIPQQPTEGSLDAGAMMRTTKAILNGADQARIQYQSIFAIKADKSVFPFGPDENAPELLQHFHDPLVRGQINRLIGVNFIALPWQTQIHLMRFLLDKDTDTFVQLQEILQAHPKEASAILTSFLACAQDTDLGHAILQIAQTPGTGKIFQTYAELAGTAIQTATEIHQIHVQTNPTKPVTVEAVYKSLLSTANNGLRSTAEKLKGSTHFSVDDGKIFADSLAKQLRHHDEHIRLTRALVAALPPEEVATINLLQLSTVELKSASGQALLEKPDLAPMLKRMTNTIDVNFPPGDAEDFNERYLKQQDAEVFYSTCAGELLSFFGTSRMPDGTRYLDWFNTSPQSPIRGLGEATAYTVLNRLVQKEDWYLVAKPHVRSHEIFARAGFVTFGTTIPGHTKPDGQFEKGEYQHRYLRCRKLSQEHNDQYIGKQLTPDEQATVRGACTAKNALTDVELRGTTVKVCRVEYTDIDHQNDIAPGSEDDFLFQTVDHLCGEHGMVMSAYIPDKRNNDREWRKVKRQSYYCVFEKSRLPESASDALAGSIHAFHQHPGETTHPETEATAA